MEHIPWLIEWVAALDKEKYPRAYLKLDPAYGGEIGYYERASRGDHMLIRVYGPFEEAMAALREEAEASGHIAPEPDWSAADAAGWPDGGPA